MVTPETEHQRVKEGDTASPTIVAFDFDGTLTTHDTFTAFLRWRAGLLAYVAGIIRLTPQLVAYLFTRDRGALKAAAARLFLQGATREELETDAEAFAETHMARLIRPDALAVWREHAAKGATMAIVTASPETVIAPFARRLGADWLIGTQLGFDESGRFTGRFCTPNCRAEEKVLRLKAAFGDDMTLAAAYGDTSGDLAMLAFASEGHMKVFSGRP
jgi:phosphatidylglycerophosphatase C